MFEQAFHPSLVRHLPGVVGGCVRRVCDVLRRQHICHSFMMMMMMIPRFDVPTEGRAQRSSCRRSLLLPRRTDQPRWYHFDYEVTAVVFRVEFHIISGFIIVAL